MSDLVIITRTSNGKAAEKQTPDSAALIKFVPQAIPFIDQVDFRDRTEMISKIINSLSNCHQQHVTSSQVFCRINEETANRL